MRIVAMLTKMAKLFDKSWEKMQDHHHLGFRPRICMLQDATCGLAHGRVHDWVCGKRYKLQLNLAYGQLTLCRPCGLSAGRQNWG